MPRANNREIPFVGVAREVNYDKSLPMSANCLQFGSTKSVYIIRGVQLSHCRTSVRQGLHNT